MALSRGKLMLGIGTLTAGLLTGSFANAESITDAPVETNITTTINSLAQDLKTQGAYQALVLDSSMLGKYKDSGETIKDILKNEALQGKYVAVELTSGLCPHCERFQPELDKALTKLSADGLDVVRLTVVMQEGSIRERKRGNIAYPQAVKDISVGNALPQVLLYKDGEQKDVLNGARPAAQVEQFIKTNVDAQQPANPPQPKAALSPS